MSQYYFPDIFDMVLGSGIFERKPSPQGLIYLARELGIKRDKLIYVGDSEIDVQRAKNAGVLCLQVDWGYQTPLERTRVISSPGELLLYL